MLKTIGLFCVSIVALAILCSACTDEPMTVAPQSPDKKLIVDGPVIETIGDAEILGISVDPGSSDIVVFVRYSEEQLMRNVYIRQSDVSIPGYYGYAAEIVGNNTLLFGVDLSRPDSEDVEFRAVEWTSTDELEIRGVAEETDTITETYTWGGDAQSFSYNPLVVPVSNAASQQVIDDFQSFYTGSSLESNIDGDRLIALLNSTLFWETIEMELVDQGVIAPDPSKRITWNDVGAGGTIIGFFKCALGGGLLNPVCIAATGISIAVAAAHLICRIPGVDC